MYTLMFMLLIHPDAGGSFSSLPFKVGDVVESAAGPMNVIKKLGEGAYGIVFLCLLLKTDAKVALKIEKPAPPILFHGSVPAHFTRIEHEFAMLQLLKHLRYPRVYGYDFNSKYKYMVMDYAGDNAWGLLKKNPEKRLYTFQVIQLAVQLFDIVEQIHDTLGIIVYDLHPGNFVYSYVNGSIRYQLIDPGMAYPFRVNGLHIKKVRSPIPQSKKNPLWTCLADDAEIIATRACEVERILYVLLHLLLGKLPWEPLLKLSLDRVRHYKRIRPLIDICNDPNARFMIPAFRYARQLGFEERPDYNRLRQIFRDQLKNLYPRNPRSV